MIKPNTPAQPPAKKPEEEKGNFKVAGGKLPGAPDPKAAAATKPGVDISKGFGGTTAPGFDASKGFGGTTKPGAFDTSKGFGTTTPIDTSKGFGGSAKPGGFDASKGFGGSSTTTFSTPKPTPGSGFPTVTQQAKTQWATTSFVDVMKKTYDAPTQQTSGGKPLLVSAEE